MAQPVVAKIYNPLPNFVSNAMQEGSQLLQDENGDLWVYDGEAFIQVTGNSEVLGLGVSYVSSAISLTTNGQVIVGISDTSSARTVTLKTSDMSAGHIVFIKDESGAANVNNITVATQGAEKIDGADTKVINSAYGALRLYSDGSNWFTI